MPNLPRRWLAAEEEWGGLGMLDGIDCCRPQVAEIMSAVRRGNEAMGQGGLDKHGVAFTLASIPLVRKVAAQWVVPQLVSMQPLSGREGQFAFCRFDGQIAAHPCVCRTRPVPQAVLPPVPPDRVGDKEAVGPLAKAIDRAATLIADSLDAEVVTDLVRTATTVVNEPEHLLAGLAQAGEGVERRLGGPGPTWAMMNVETANELGLEFEGRPRFGVGEAGGLQVLVDMRPAGRVLPPRVVLVGRLGEEFYDAGYFFCPWLLVSGPPAQGLPKDQIYVRYSKNVLAGKMNEYPRGTSYYARIHLKAGTKLGAAVQAAAPQMSLEEMLGDRGEWDVTDDELDPIRPDGGDGDWAQRGEPLDGENGELGVAEVVDGAEDGPGFGLQERDNGDGPGVPGEEAEAGGVGGDGEGVPGEAGTGEGGPGPVPEVRPADPAGEGGVPARDEAVHAVQ